MKKVLFLIITLFGIGLSFGFADNFSFNCSDSYSYCSPGLVSLSVGTYCITSNSAGLDYDFCYGVGNTDNCVGVENFMGQCFYLNQFNIYNGFDSSSNTVIGLTYQSSGGGSSGGGGSDGGHNSPTPYNGNIIQSLSGANLTLNDEALASGIGEPMFFWYGQLLNVAITFFPVVLVVSMFWLIYGYLKHLGNKNSLDSKKSLDNK